MTMSPLQLAFYKGAGGKNGALQLNLQRPHFFVKSNPKLRNFDGRYVLKEWTVDKEGRPLPEAQIPRVEDMTSREGALFVEITSATGKNIYDWENKITMALSIEDMGKALMVLEGLEPEVNILHDPGARTVTQGKVQKYLNISSPKGLKAGVLVSISQKAADGNTVKHMVPLSGDETRILATCIRHVIPLALAW